MKIKTLLILSLLLLLLEAHSQNSNTGQVSGNYDEAAPTIENRNSEMPSTLNFDCSTVFWTIDFSGNIKQWNLSGGIVSGGTTILQSQNLYGISFCGNAFYCPGDTTIEKYTDTSGWTTITTPMTFLGNNGGYGYRQYYFSDTLTKLNYYDGTTFTTIEDLSTTPTLHYTVADLAVDSSGRAWVFCGSDNGVSSSLRVYDSHGLIAQYPFNLNTVFGYGTFFINDVLYIGFGSDSSNPNSNKLLPILFNGVTVSTGTPIPFVRNGYNDLASCNSAANLNLMPHISVANLTITPNPAINEFAINTDRSIDRVEVFDILGRLIKTVSNKKSVDISELKSGTYLLKIKIKDQIVSKKIVKE